MIRFGYFRLNGRLVIYDITEELIHGHRHWVASLSENPEIHFTAIRPVHAVENLKQYLEEAAQPAVTWLPDLGERPTTC